MATEPGDKIITYASYYDPMLAHLIRTKLEDNDIPCFVADENFLTANPIYNQAAGGIKLKIFERDLERCKEILAEDDALIEQANAEDLSSDAVICPLLRIDRCTIRFCNRKKDKLGSCCIINVLSCFSVFCQ
jgi:hypothetical protein